MKRIVILTIGPTHSGKTTIARQLEQAFPHFIVLDQDKQAEFLNTHYEKLVPQSGPNTLKFLISETLLHYAIAQTSYNLILCNSNIHKAPRQQLLARFFPAEQFVRVYIHFALAQDVLQNRIDNTLRDTKLFRDVTYTYEELLEKQLPQIDSPTCDEVDYILTIHEQTTTQQLVSEIEMIIHKEQCT
ncbi:AAA family ATPase [Solibacillus sp. FSL R7-0668]|uniref:AAA family ATPase n=1 Tax=Solibacillus sp. FSL R7-0668 TaxID=2921688 RepID=UPI0030FCC87D